MSSALMIGEVARQSGVAIDTVRYYERRGVLPRVERRRSGFRQFTAATVERIRFAKELQSLGFNLDDIVALLRAVDTGSASCEGEQHRFEQVLAKVDARIRELTAVRGRLRRTLKRCRDGQCTLLESKPPKRPAATKRAAKPRAPRGVLS